MLKTHFLLEKYNFKKFKFVNFFQKFKIPLIPTSKNYFKIGIFPKIHFLHEKKKQPSLFFPINFLPKVPTKKNSRSFQGHIMQFGECVCVWENEKTDTYSSYDYYFYYSVNHHHPHSCCTFFFSFLSQSGHWKWAGPGEVKVLVRKGEETMAFCEYSEGI